MFNRDAALLMAFVGVLLFGLPPGESSRPTTSCQFVLGFRALRGEIPAIVGDCLENEHHNPETGDGLQRTTKGLLVWRKSDNFTAFTDGYRTWVAGPFGLQERLNTVRFDWEREPGGTPVAEIEAVFLGDSYFEFWDVQGAFASVRVVNRGIWGQTTGQILQRFNSDVVVARPRYVVIIAGANDVLGNVPPSDTRANVRALLEQARAHGIVVLMATAPPARPGSEVSGENVGEYNRRIRELNDWIRTNAPLYGAIVVDFSALLVDSYGQLDPAYSDKDGLHLNGDGYERLAQLLRPHLAPRTP